MVSRHVFGQTKRYQIDHEQWQSLLVPNPTDKLAWVNWRYLTRGLTTLWRAILALDAHRADDYVFSSQARKAMQAAQDDIMNSGLALSIKDNRDYVAESYLPVFQEDIHAIMQHLVG